MTATEIEAKASEWIGRRELDSWSEDDNRALKAWLDESLAHRVAFVRLVEAHPPAAGEDLGEAARDGARTRLVANDGAFPRLAVGAVGADFVRAGRHPDDLLRERLALGDRRQVRADDVQGEQLVGAEAGRARGADELEPLTADYADVADGLIRVIGVIRGQTFLGLHGWAGLEILP